MELVVFNGNKLADNIREKKIKDKSNELLLVTTRI
jgi:hypothetical protein